MVGRPIHPCHVCCRHAQPLQDSQRKGVFRPIGFVSWVIGYIVVAIVMAKRWRRAQVLTDVEFIELRYDGACLSAQGI